MKDELYGAVYVKNHPKGDAQISLAGFILLCKNGYRNVLT